MDSKSDKSWLLGLGRGPAGHDRVFAVGTNAKKMVSQHSGVYSLVTGKAEWRFRLRLYPVLRTAGSLLEEPADCGIAKNQLAMAVR